jgi:hypothetical protein
MKPVLAAALVLAGCGTDAGGGGGGTGYGTGEAYFPFIEGGRWTYNVIVGNKVLGQLTEDQSLVTRLNGLTTVHVRFSGQNPFGDGQTRVQSDLTWRQTADQVSSVDENGKETLLFKLPLASGTTWNVNDTPVRVAGTENVSVPAGAYRGALLITGENADVAARAWLVSGVGLVKLELKPRKAGETARVELATFTP